MNNNLKKIALLHPFSAEAIGLNEKDLYYSHSKPHEKALREIQGANYTFYIDYFTGNILPYSKIINGVKKRFWPISKPFFFKRHFWRKQFSLVYSLNYFFSPADLTIINMSGHGSKYSFRLARLIINKGKKYITMIGGMHMSASDEALEYYKNAHHIIVHTEVQKKNLLALEGFKNLDIRVMPLGVDTNKFKPIPIKNENVINLLYVGRISRLKQIEFVIEALLKLKEKDYQKVKLTIIGPKSDSTYFNELQLLIKKNGLERFIKFIDAIKQDELIPYYQKASLLLLPSAHESFGMVMVEAMACGTPVAAFKGAGGPDDIISDKVDGILSTSEKYSVDIIRYFENKQLQKKMSNEARDKVIANFSDNTTYKVLKKSIEDALK